MNKFYIKGKFLTVFFKNIATIILGPCGLLILFNGCHTQNHEKAKEVKFQVTSPLKKDTSITKEYVCQIQAIQHIELRALEAGYLQNIYVDEGQLINKGQLMFQITPLIYQAELQKAEAEANFAEIEYNNTKALADSNIVSSNELALVQAKWNKAKAELALAQAHLQFTEIRAPFHGLMDQFHVRHGSLLEEGEMLTTLADISKLWVYFNVPEAEYLDYKTRLKKDSALKVKLLLANQQVFEYPGEVTTIEADFNQKTGNIAFRATFPNHKGLLRHGETGNILMNVVLKDALLVPQKATFEILDKKYVFVVDKDSVIRSRQITIGEEMTHLYVVEEGLTENDKILLEGLRKVRDGDRLNYEYLKPEQALSQLELYAE